MLLTIFLFFVDPIAWGQLSSIELVHAHHSRQTTSSNHLAVRLIRI